MMNASNLQKQSWLYMLRKFQPILLYLFLFSVNFHASAYQAPEPDLKMLTSQNAASIQLISTFEAQALSHPDYISFSLDGKKILFESVKLKNIAEVWDIYPAPALVSILRTSRITSARLSSTGKFTSINQYSDDAPTNYILFDTESGEIIKNLGQVHSVTFNPQDTLVAFSTFSETIPEETSTIIWDLIHQREIWRYDYPLTGDLAFSPDGNLLAIAGADQTVSIVDITLPPSEAIVFAVNHSTDAYISDLRFIFQNHVAFISRESDYSTVYTWNVVNKTNVYRVRTYPGVFLAQNRAFVILYWTDEEPGRVLEFWSLWNGIRIGEVAAYGDINPDTSLIMGIAGELSLYSIITGKKLFTFPHCADKCTGYFNPDGKTILIHYGKTVEIWGVPAT